MCYQMGAGQQYLNSILTECRHFEPVVSLPVILVLHSAVKEKYIKVVSGDKTSKKSRYFISM